MTDRMETTAIEKEMAELAKEPEIEIVLSDDKDDGAKGEDPREALQQMKSQFEEQRRLADQERQARIQWQQRAHHSDYVAVSNAAENAERQYASLADKLKDALERYDATEAANIQLKMTEMSRHVQDLRDAVERTKNPPRPQVDRRTAEDQWLQTQTRENREIIEAYRDRFFNDPQTQQKMVAAAQFAVQNLGIQPSDPNYREFIEEQAGLSRQGASRRSSSTPTTTTTAAPPSRYVPGSRSNSTSRVTLTREQRDHARFLYPDSKDPDTQYARRILADHRAGLCDANGKYYQQ